MGARRKTGRGETAQGLQKVGVVGLGYVGLPLFIAISKKITAVGYDIDESKIAALQGANAAIPGTTPTQLKSALRSGSIVTNVPMELTSCDAVVICVPTPVGPSGKPDLSPVRSAATTVSKQLKRGQLIVLESTTYPGTTREVVLPILEGGSRACGADFFLAYSPERIDPGNPRYSVINTPKLVGGIDAESGTRAKALYEQILEANVQLVSSAEVAESAKMLENVFRNINIALINELSLVFDQLGLNTWEIVQAASTKPYGFMAFYPGPGIGGHCIPVDPLYLSYRARQVGVTPRFIELGYHVNSFMPVHAVNLAELAFRQLRGKSLNRAVIGVLGLAYKRDIPDTRESPSIHIVEELRARGARVVVHDPLAPLPPELEGEVQKTKEWQQVLKESDVALFVVDHSQYKAISIATINPWLKDHYLVDCRNIFPVSHPRIVGVGRGRPFMNGKGNSGP